MFRLGKDLIESSINWIFTTSSNSTSTSTSADTDITTDTSSNSTQNGASLYDIDTNKDNESQSSTDEMSPSTNNNKNKSSPRWNSIMIPTPLTRKRAHNDVAMRTSSTPHLIYSPSSDNKNLSSDFSSKKRRKTSHNFITNTATLYSLFHEPNNTLLSHHSTSSSSPPKARSILEVIPHDVLQEHILSYVTETQDRYSISMTCRSFSDIMNCKNIRKVVDLSGDAETGKCSLLRGVESSDEALERLFPFASCGNLQALYMTGMITIYCYGSSLGVNILKHSSKLGCPQSSYILGIILRESSKQEADSYLHQAANTQNHIPACHELLTSEQVKERFGEMDATQLSTLFDSFSLNLLLGKCYLQNKGVRRVQSSHCWNPLCGRWAFKAITTANVGIDHHGELVRDGLGGGERERELMNEQQQQQAYINSLPSLSSSWENLLKSLSGAGQKQPQQYQHLEMNFCSRESSITSRSMPYDTTTAEAAILPSDTNGTQQRHERPFRVSRMKICSVCRRAKYCSKLCQVYDWRSGRHKTECHYLH